MRRLWKVRYQQKLWHNGLHLGKCLLIEYYNNIEKYITIYFFYFISSNFSRESFCLKELFALHYVKENSELLINKALSIHVVSAARSIDELKERMEMLQRLYANLDTNEIRFPPQSVLLILDQTRACMRIITFAEKLHKKYNTEIYSLPLEPGKLPLSTLESMLSTTSVDMIIAPPTIEGINRVAQKYGVPCMIIPAKYKKPKEESE